MPYERVERIYCPPFKYKEECRYCPLRDLVAAAGNAAVGELCSTEGAADTPDYAIARKEKGFWTTKEADTRLRATDPEYAAARDRYDTAAAQWTDMSLHCSGGVIDRPPEPEGQSTHTCRYEPSGDVPPVPMTAGTTLLNAPHKK